MIKLNIENEYDFSFDINKISKIIVSYILEYEKLNYDFSVNISVVNNKTIKRLNKKNRSINKETDVLSFPNINFQKPSDLKKYINKKAIDVSIIDLTTKTIFLGDVVISYEKVNEQSKKYGHSVKREFSFLLTHSMLHLLGYDHKNKSQEKTMFNKQDIILENVGITR